MDKQHIISEIKRTAKENGGIPLGRDRFQFETGISTRDWLGTFWARWGDALIEAGYEPNRLQGSYKDEVVIEKMISFIRELGKYPVNAELKLKAKQSKEFPSHSVFSRVGKKAEFARKVINYCEGKKGFNDIIEICKPIAETGNNQLTTTEKQLVLGYVYLIKSGKYYKIGKSIAPGRREYDIGLKLPEEIKRVHVIKTDDPDGIEAYWHKRFKDRRKRGEWFDLTSEDVKIFKRRKFM